jgi:hypothetical protein
VAKVGWEIVIAKAPVAIVALQYAVFIIIIQNLLSML